MGVFRNSIIRTSTDAIRAEDYVLQINNDKDKGSKNIFTYVQLGLLNTIVTCVHDFFSVDTLRDVPIYDVPINLIPYEEIVVWMTKNRCNSAFAKKMRKQHEKEMQSIPDNCPKDEREKREKKLRKKYGSWLCKYYPCTSGCNGVWSTPLGYFDPEKFEIYICLDRIIDTYPKEQVGAIAAKVTLHELGHAMMHNPQHLNYETLFEYWAEEALANKIALKYLSAASKLRKKPELFASAKEMVEHQDAPYRFGLYAYEHNALDWKTLKENKPNIDEKKGDLWVNAACEDNPVFLDIQKLFYDTFC